MLNLLLKDRVLFLLLFQLYNVDKLYKYSGYLAIHHKYSYGACQQEFTECLQVAALHACTGLTYPQMLRSNNIYQMAINHNLIKESRTPRIIVTAVSKPKVMTFYNAERGICLSKHYFSSKNNRYLSFFPSKPRITWQTGNLCFFCFCFGFGFFWCI